VGLQLLHLIAQRDVLEPHALHLLLLLELLAHALLDDALRDGLSGAAVLRGPRHLQLERVERIADVVCASHPLFQTRLPSTCVGCE